MRWRAAVAVCVAVVLSIFPAVIIAAQEWRVPCPTETCSYSAIVDVASKVGTGDTVVIDSGTFIGPCGTTAANTATFAADEVVIKGTATVIDCQLTGQAFIIMGSAFSVSGVVFQSTSAGALTFHGTSGFANGCTFRDCEGGVVRHVNNDATELTLQDCTFLDNTVTTIGGLIYAQNKLTITRAYVSRTFISFASMSGSYQGAIQNEGFLDMRNSFLCNSHGLYSCTVLCAGTGNIRDSVVKNNSCAQPTQGTEYPHAVTIFRRITTIYGTNFASNSDGSAFRALYGASFLHCNFTDNTGGSAFSSQALDKSDGRINFIMTSRFERNGDPTLPAGGAVSILGQPDVGNFFISDSYFIQNTAVSGGAVQWNLGTLTITNALFEGNSAQTGGAVDAVRVVLAGDVTFRSNTASTRGGAIDASFIHAEDQEWVGPSHMYFEDNLSNGDGGAIACSGLQCEITLYNLRSTFQRNRAGGSGGGIWTARALNSFVNITHGHFLSNSAGGNGGGMLVRTGGFQGGFFSNTAAHGGALAVVGRGDINYRDSPFVVDDSTFADNVATESAGAIWLGDEPAAIKFLTSPGNKFSGNTGDQGENFGCTTGVLMLDNPAVTTGLALTGVRCELCGCCLAPQMPFPASSTGCFYLPNQVCQVSCPQGYYPQGGDTFTCVNPPFTYSYDKIVPTCVGTVGAPPVAPPPAPPPAPPRPPPPPRPPSPAPAPAPAPSPAPPPPARSTLTTSVPPSSTTTTSTATTTTGEPPAGPPPPSSPPTPPPPPALDVVTPIATSTATATTSPLSSNNRSAISPEVFAISVSMVILAIAILIGGYVYMRRRGQIPVLRRAYDRRATRPRPNRTTDNASSAHAVDSPAHIPLIAVTGEAGDDDNASEGVPIVVIADEEGMVDHLEDSKESIL